MNWAVSSAKAAPTHLRVLLDDVADAALLEVLDLVLLEVEAQLGTAAERGVGLVERDGEGSAGRRRPDVLLIVIVLGDHLHPLGHEVRRVETDTELADHADVRARRQRLHERLGARLGDRAEVVDQVGLGHAAARVADAEHLVRLVGRDADVQL